MKFLLLTLPFYFLSLAAFAEGLKRPDWIDQPLEACPAHELCVVGEGTGPMNAEANARKALAQYFETKVKGSTKSSTSAGQVSNLSSASVDEHYRSEVEESTEEVLKGVVIKKKFEDGEGSYALAALDKNKAAKGLKSEMGKIDEVVGTLYQDGKRASLNKVLRQLALRDKLNERYELLAGSRFPSPVTFAAVVEKKKKFREQSKIVFVQWEDSAGSTELKKTIIQQLVENDYQVVTKKGLPHHYSLVGKVIPEKQYLNVDGFEKYKFLLSIRSQDDKGVKSGALEFQSEQVGRKLEQAYQNSLPDLKKYIQEHLNELNID